MKFGQYELLERVAVGGMAEVFRGRVVGAEGFEKWVAIKRILPEFAQDDRFISMMLTEARIHSALSHRNIVQIHDLGTSEDGEYFIVLEYVEGHDLRAVLEAAGALGVQVPDNLALHIADELAQALHFAHELREAEGQPLGIIHRDVSPSNVLISNAGEVKLSDFGIAKRRRDHSVVGSLKGNLGYMSPEQARRAALDRRTDVFSLGAVLFEMLTGAKIRDVSDEVNGFQQAASGAVRSATELRPDLPEAYSAILSRALAANPADRFADAASFGAAIRELQRAGDRPVGPTDVQELIEVLNPPRRARSPVERSRVIRLGPEFRVATPSDAPVPVPVPVPVPATSMASATVRPSSPLRAALAPRPRATTENGIGALLTLGSPPSSVTPAATPPIPGRAPPVPGGTPPVPRRTPPPPPARQATPARPVAATPPPMSVGLATARALSALNAVALPSPATPVPTQIRSDSRSESKPSPSSRGAIPFTPPPAGASARGTTRNPGSQSATPPPEDGDVGKTPAPYSGAVPLAGWAAPPAVVPLKQAPAKPFRETGLQLREPLSGAPPAASGVAPDVQIHKGHWRSISLAALAALGAAATIVHFKVMPLGVVAVWTRPAQLAVDSEPPGATVILDGQPLPGLTPLRADVKRDRVDHVIELKRAGWIAGRTSLRFDRTVPLEASMILIAEPPPPPPPVTAEPSTPPSAPAPAAPGDVGATSAKAGGSASIEADSTQGGTKASRKIQRAKAKKESKKERLAEKRALKMAARKAKIEKAKSGNKSPKRSRRRK